MFWYGLLLQYENENGSARVPVGFKSKDRFRLGGWVNNQRTRKDSLSVERRDLLESLTGWSWDPHTEQWDEAFAHLQDFVKKNGSARVARGFKTKNGFNLGNWVGTQRHTKDLLSAERRNLLESLTGWSWDPHTEQWDEGFTNLQEYVKKNGSARVPASFKTKDGFALGIWVNNQRSRKDSLSVARRDILESLKGWSWDALTDKWSEAFEQLKQYVKQNGSTRVPQRFKTKDGFALGIWVSSQRAKEDSLSVERRNLLESLKGWSWDPHTDRWNEGFANLQEYVKKNGSARVPTAFKTKDGFALGIWVATQRGAKTSLFAERRKLLDSSCKDWTWDSLTDRWNEAFAHLQEYVKRNGSARVPQVFKTKNGFALGTWVSTQRVKKESLSVERRNLLESSCADWAWDALTDKWSKGFEQLQQYVKANGSARVPQGFKTKDGFALGAWVNFRRGKKDSLSVERRNLLESLKGWSWDPHTDQWNEAFANLQEYVKRNGTARVPQGFKTKDGFALGIWVATQRKKRDKQTAERKKRLGLLRGWAWDARS
jgi:hypothetical protein